MRILKKLTKYILLSMSLAVLTLVAPATPVFAATAATWSVHPAADDTETWRDIAWSPELKLFAAVGSNAIMTSPDGITWTSRTSPTGSWASVAWSPVASKFVAVGIGSSNNMAHSSNGIDWATAPVGAAALNAITWSPGKNQFVAVGVGTTPSVTIAPDMTYTLGSTGAIGLTGVTWSDSDGIYVASAGGTGLGRTYASADGLSWTLYNTPPVNGPWNDIIYAEEQDLFVVIGTNGVVTSPDGMTWTQQTSPLADLINITYSPDNQEFVAVGNSGGVQTSPDGVTWTAVASPNANNLRGITWSPELYRYVGVANSGTNRVLVGLVPTVADAPINLVATSSNPAKADLSWTPPSFDGNTAITGYRIERSANGGAFTIIAADVAGTTFQDTGLDPNATYRYRVFAINVMGTSVASNETPLTRLATLADTGVSQYGGMAVACGLLVLGMIIMLRLRRAQQ